MEFEPTAIAMDVARVGQRGLFLGCEKIVLLYVPLEPGREHLISDCIT